MNIHPKKQSVPGAVYLVQIELAEDMKRINVLFSGTVQGVGFRFTAERIAKYFDITGYVRNLPSGKVEIVAEGEDNVLKDFLKAVQESSMQRYIRGADVSWSDAEGRFKSFGIAP